jgi:hypothetical protein
MRKRRTEPDPLVQPERRYVQADRSQRGQTRYYVAADPPCLLGCGVMRALNQHVEPVLIRHAKKSIGADANSRAIDEAGSRPGRSMSEG